MQLLVRNRASYISLIRKHPDGLPNRLEPFDKWVATWNEPNIHSYEDYFRNGETRKQEMFMPDCPRSKAALDFV
jgi:hypothetical protein